MAKGDPDKRTPATKVVTGGRKEEWTGIPGQPGRVVNPAVWRASTHLYENCAALAEGPKTNEDGRFFYGRRGAPTQWALAEALTALEPGADGIALWDAANLEEDWQAELWGEDAEAAERRQLRQDAFLLAIRFASLAGASA